MLEAHRFWVARGTIALMKKHIVYLWVSAAVVLLVSSYLSWNVVLAENVETSVFLACATGMVVSVGVLLYCAVLMMLDMEFDQATPTNASLGLEV